MRKLLLITAVAGFTFTVMGSSAASATAHTYPGAYITNSHGDVLAEAQLSGHNAILVCDRSTDHRYAMAKVRYKGHTYQYANYYKDQDCIEQKTIGMPHGQIELWACVSKPYKVKFAHCGPKKTIVRP
ncbi:hypothetical protein ACFPOI_25110 [Nonomuraea angiospora]|uniref:Secreted protein n=1 Tax=Nonomuraea angiospora TaxID=46172 RepID=A0ABR9LQK4_9ACTN|nr:hypothetical protein [Nonomuraea angiospora]MBE1582567.1 hypothetical protein [Nonomuraea angiospora]